jgi:hypothetical protein
LWTGAKPDVGGVVFIVFEPQNRSQNSEIIKTLQEHSRHCVAKAACFAALALDRSLKTKDSPAITRVF